MSITTEINRTAELTTDGVETEFDFSLLIHADTELEVYYEVTGGSYTQLTLGTDYTVVFTESGGMVTTIGGSSPYAAGKILIIRHIELTQQTNWLYNDNHSEQQHQDDFDRSVMRDLQIQEELDRSPKFPTYSETVDITFPEPEANALIGWNAAGTDLENKDDITGLVSLPVTDGNFIVGDGTTWVAESGATARASLGLTIGTDVLAQQTIGIADDNLLEVDGTANSGEYARFTADGLEGRTLVELAGELDHGNFVGLGDDDHTIYSLIDGTRDFTGVVVGVTPTSHAHLATKEYVDDAIGTILDYFFNNTAAGIDLETETTYNMEMEIYAGEEEISREDITAAPNQLLFVFATLSGEPGGLDLVHGVYNAHMHLEVTGAGARSVDVHWTLSSIDDDGTNEVLIMTSEIETGVSGSEAPYSVHATLGADVEVAAASRLLFKLYGDGNAGNDATMAFHVEGNTGAHVAIKAPSAIFNTIYIRQDEFTQDSGVLVGTGAGTYQEEVGATLRTSLGLGTGDSPQFTALNIGTTSDLFISGLKFHITHTDDIVITGEAGAPEETVIAIGDGVAITGENDLSCGAITSTGSITGADLAIDTATLTVDAVNHRVGIGTTAPSRKLDIEGTANAYQEFHATNHNQWVIGSETRGFAFYDDTNNEYRMIIGKTDNAGVTIGTGYAGTSSEAPSNGLIIEGNVGIGVTNPDFKLEVNGTLGAGAITGTSLTILTTGEINFRDTDISIGSTLTDGILDISADVAIDLFFDNADRGAEEDGQHLNINRRAAGDDYISLYVNKDRKGLIGFSGDDDLLQLEAGALTVNGTIGSGAITSTGLITGADLAIDSDTLIVDAVNNAVGIGTATPSRSYGSDYFLEITGPSNPALVLHDTGQGSEWSIVAESDDLGILYGSAHPFVVQNNGNVGINKRAPVARLHIDQATSDAAIPVLILDQADVSEGFINFIGSDRGIITGATDSLKSVRVELGGVVYRLALYVDG